MCGNYCVQKRKWWGEEKVNESVKGECVGVRAEERWTNEYVSG